MTTNRTHTIRTSAGFSIVELVLYIALLTLVVGVLVQTGVSLLRTMTYMRAQEEVAQAATIALDRITRELRFASSVSTGASVLGTNPGTLSLQTVDESGTATTVTVTVTDGRVTLARGGAEAIPLTHDIITVTNLVFTRMLSTETEGVLVDLTLERTVQNTTIAKSFRTFVVLDAS